MGDMVRRRFRFRDPVQEAVPDAGAEQPFAAPRAVRNEDRLPRHVIVRVVHKQPQRLVRVALDHVVKVALAPQDAARVANDPIAERDESGRLGGAPFEDFEDVPHLLERVLRVAQPERESEERGLVVDRARRESV